MNDLNNFNETFVQISPTNLTADSVNRLMNGLQRKLMFIRENESAEE